MGSVWQRQFFTAWSTGSREKGSAWEPGPTFKIAAHPPARTSLPTVSKNLQNNECPPLGNPALNTWAFLIYKPLYRCWVFWVQDAGRCRIWRKPISGLHFLIFSWLRKKANEPCIPSCHMTVWGQTESCRQVSSSSIFHLHFLDTFLPEPGTHWFSWTSWSSSLRGPPSSASASPVLRCQVCANTSAFSHKHWGFKLRPWRLHSKHFAN